MRLAIIFAALAIVVIAIVAHHQSHGPDMRTVDDVLKIQNVSGGNR